MQQLLIFTSYINTCNYHIYFFPLNVLFLAATFCLLVQESTYSLEPTSRILCCDDYSIVTSISQCLPSWPENGIQNRVIPYQLNKSTTPTHLRF